MYDAMIRYGLISKAAVLNCLALLSLLAGMAVVAGEAPPPETAAKKTTEEKPFQFVPGNRRDPFCFRRKPDVPVEPTEPIKGAGGEITDQPMDAVQLEKRKADAEKAYMEAETAFLEIGRDGRAPDIITKCDAGLDVLKDIPSIAKYQELMLVRERLLDLRRAADNMVRRQAAEKKFGELNIRITGIVFRDKHSQAIISGKPQPVGRGDVVAVSDSNEVIVDEIRPDQVVFVFQGYKMMLTLSDMPSVR